MKKYITILILFLSVTAFSQNWKTNFDEAKAEAKASNKKIILVFSGSDWCAPCIKLDKSIWQSEEFKSYAAENYILYKADFPKKKANQLTDAVKKQNNTLAEKYNQEGKYPLVIVLDSNCKMIGMTGYENIAPTEYIKKLNNL